MIGVSSKQSSFKSPRKGFFSSWSKFINLVTLIFSASLLADEKAITFYTEEYPPFNYKNGAKLSGYSYDIVVEVLKRVGENHKIKLETWTKGYQNTQEPGQFNALFSTTRTKERENLFKWVGPLVDTRVRTFCHEKANFNLENSKNLKYTVVRDSIDHMLVKQMGVPETKIYDVTRFEIVYRLVSKGKVDCYVYEENVSNYLVNRFFYDISMIKAHDVLLSGQLFIAFNQTIGDDTIAKFQRVFDEVMSDTAFLAELKQRYKISGSG